MPLKLTYFLVPFPNFSSNTNLILFPSQLLLFCEGTRFTPAKLELSNEVARKKGMPELKHHLLPRTKGFVLSMHGVKDRISTISDMTVGFTDEGAEPTLVNVINGKGVNAQVFVRWVYIVFVSFAGLSMKVSHRDWKSHGT